MIAQNLSLFVLIFFASCKNQSLFKQEVKPGNAEDKTRSTLSLTEKKKVYWQRDPASDKGENGGVAGDGVCNGGEACIFIDHLSGLSWTGHQGMKSAEDAANYCRTLEYGRHQNWRLPTLSEAQRALEHRIWDIHEGLGINRSTFYWVDGGGSGWSDAKRVISWSQGSDERVVDSYGDVYGVVCVR
jgi:hypothetical protein